MSQWYPPSKPRPVADGLKARGKRGRIGTTWWSRRFIDVLESFAMGNRLTRGRAYARKGQVTALAVAPGTVSATVQGSRVRPYRVSIGLRQFSELVWARAEIALSEQALPSATLLAGEVSAELEELFAAAGAPLFPERINDLDQRCSCPDSEVPCKHLAATFYLLAEAFDDDPFLILRWRGRDRDTLLARLRELRDDGFDVAPDTGERTAAPVAGTMLALTDLPPPVRRVEHFWLPPAPLPARPPALTSDTSVLLRQLPTPPDELGGAKLGAALEAAYAKLGQRPED